MKNVFYFKKINSIGGCETFFYYLSKLFSNMVVYYKEADGKQIERLAERIECHKFKGQQIECDRFFCCYGFDIGNYVKAKEYYHIIHCDYKMVGFSPIRYDGFKYIAVSKLVKNSFEELTGEKAELIYNPIKLEIPKADKYKDKIYLISATRLTKEKGRERIEKLASILDNAGVDYVWDIYTNKQKPFNSPNIRVQVPKLNIIEEIKKSTYLVQLSTHEAYCYSIVEALMCNTPVITTDLPVLKELKVEHGKNAIVLDMNLSNVDIELIKKGLPPFKYKPPKSNWDKYLDNESNYNPNELVKVRTKKKIWDMKEDMHYKAQHFYDMKVCRARYLEALDCVEVYDEDIST